MQRIVRICWKKFLNAAVRLNLNELMSDSVVRFNCSFVCLNSEFVINVLNKQMRAFLWGIINDNDDDWGFVKLCHRKCLTLLRSFSAIFFWRKSADVLNHALSVIGSQYLYGCIRAMLRDDWLAVKKV
jgi:hypothetical protein